MRVGDNKKLAFRVAIGCKDKLCFPNIQLLFDTLPVDWDNQSSSSNFESHPDSANVYFTICDRLEHSANPSDEEDLNQQLSWNLAWLLC
jgi:hypothetical protein